MVSYTVCLVLLCCSWILEAKLHYVAIFPSEITSHHPETICIHLEGAEGESRVQIFLQLNNKNITRIDRTFLKKSLFTCIKFQVSDPNENEAVGLLTVSIENAKEKITQSSKVLVKRKRSRILVQTDKAVYKPGQTVKFRILSLNEDFKPDRIMQLPVVELQDPGSNRIGQWLNVSLNQGMADLSLPLSSEPQSGEYKIKVKDTIKTFTVEEYVLPKFDVSLQFPKFVMFNSKNFTVKVCGRYTYGKPVQGDYKISICQKDYRYWWLRPTDKICGDFVGKLAKSGCSVIEVNPDDFKLSSRNMENRLHGVASITEEGTGVQQSTSSETIVSNLMTKVSFIDLELSYKPGIPYSGLIKVEDSGDSPLPGTKVYLYSGGGEINQTLVTNDKGHASFTLNTTNWRDRKTLYAKTNLAPEPYHYERMNAVYGYDQKTISPFYSRSKSMLKLHSLEEVLQCEGTRELQVEYIIRHTELEREAKHIDLHYLVLSKGSIQSSGSVKINTENVNEDLHGEVTMTLSWSAGVSLKLHIILYILLPTGDMVADSAKFHIQRCFKNNVSIELSPGEVLPGSDVFLRLQAAPGSLCGLRAVDKSTVLMKPEQELTADKVYSLFSFLDFGEYDYRVREESDSCSPNNRFFFGRQSYGTMDYALPFEEDEEDVYTLFKHMHLKIITSADIKKPKKCYGNDGMLFMYPGLPGLAGPPASPALEMDRRPSRPSTPRNEISPVQEKVEKVRSNFPETWIWQLTAVETSGSTELHHKAPDTITDWNAGALCMGPSGFGMSPSASLRVFQPFFVELNLPYSVVRGETFILKATVFNYLKQCIKVQIAQQPTQELEQIQCADCEYSSCLCADESKTFYWNLKASKLGEVNITVRTEAVDTKEICNNEITVVPKQGSSDTVVKTLLVQAGGVLEEKSHSSLLCIQDGEGDTRTEEISLKVPGNILEDSERAYITVLGDLMGTAMQNLDRLLAMPYGCGEQNMVLFAPNIFVLQYLEKTHQLNSEIQSKAIKFLKSGYQRQLTYKRDDGSYSAFGKSDPEGNTWLTAFVVKSFSKARPYIYIDETHLNHSLGWLKSNQLETGCFRSVGRLFNNAMKGGVEDEISLSAYVTIALLEAGVSREDPLVRDAVSCLGKTSRNVTNVYTQALLLYTFTLCGEKELSKALLKKLEKKAVKGDGQLHWKRNSAPPSCNSYWYRAPSAEVELAAYVLLALVSSPRKHLGKASEIVNWLSKQQNPYGGYSSTQDTVVALQALSKYAEHTFSDTGDVTVKVTSTSGFLEQFHVDKNNRLLLQKATLPSIPGEYTVTAAGRGCVYVQTVLRYNIPPPKPNATFILSAKSVTRKQCQDNAVVTFDLLINVSYIGSRVHSNMAVIEIKMLSGYIPVRNSIEQLEQLQLIKRSDIQNDVVMLYLNEVGPSRQDFTISVTQDIEVKDLQPATVKVYDYYETDEHAIAEYNHPCN